jgi:hypothetical protein
VQQLPEIEVFDTKPGQLQPPLASEDNSPAAFGGGSPLANQQILPGLMLNGGFRILIEESLKRAPVRRRRHRFE